MTSLIRSVVAPLWNPLKMALRELVRHPMRSFLTMLGIIIGVAAVIALVTIGAGATQSVTDSISSLGNDLVMVSPGSSQKMGPATPAAALTVADARALAKGVVGQRAVAATAQKQVLVSHAGDEHLTSVTGADLSYFEIRDLQVATGRLPTDAEAASGSGVCVIGGTVVDKVLGGVDGVGEQIRLGRTACRVVGILERKGAGMMGMDNDDVIVMPLVAFQQRVAGNRDVSTIYLAADEGASSSVRQQSELIMRDRRHIRDGDVDDFSVRDMKEIIDTVSQTTGLLTALLGAIAAVSLLVGGIGIMNIMLVSVTERTREIGIRLAIGALGKDVLQQFLVEGVVLSALGGTVGVVVGLTGAWATTLALEMPFLPSLPLVVGAVVFSSAVGVLFGFLPARKAAALQPIDALRHE